MCTSFQMSFRLLSVSICNAFMKCHTCIFVINNSLLSSLLSGKMFFFFFWSLLVCMRNYPDFVSINHWIVVGLLTFDYYISIQVVVVDHKNPWKLPTNTTLDYTKIGRSRSNEYFTLAQQMQTISNTHQHFDFRSDE